MFAFCGESAKVLPCLKVINSDASSDLPFGLVCSSILIVKKMPHTIVLLAVVYLLLVFLILTLAKRLTKTSSI